MTAAFKWWMLIEPEVATEYAGTRLGDYFTDPDIMLETEVRARKRFYELFGYGSPEVKAVSVGNLFYTCASVLGAKVVFPEDASPSVEGRVLPDIRDVRRMRVVGDVSRAGYIPEVIRQYEHLKKKEAVTGVAVSFGLGGIDSPLGTAIVLRGTELFLDIVTNPSAVKDLLEIITETSLRIIRFTEEFTGVKRESFGTSDDYGGLVSPEVFAEFNFPFLKRLFDAFGMKGRSIHSETYGRGHLRFLKMLGITNYDAWPYHGLTVTDVREELPGAFFSWNFTTKEILSDTPAEINEEFRKAVSDGAPGMALDLCAPRIPPANIRAFIETAQTLSRKE